MSVRHLRTGVALVAVALGLATTSTASAMTVTVGEPELIAKVAITVPVTVTCDPVSTGLVVFSQSVSVLVEQASGRDIARGTASLFASLPQALLFPCNGAPTTLSVSVLADPTGPPFHGGRAVARVTASAEAGVPLGCCPGGPFIAPFESQRVLVGPMEVRLH
jgi:hypothetical protein